MEICRSALAGEPFSKCISAGLLGSITRDIRLSFSADFNGREGLQGNSDGAEEGKEISNNGAAGGGSKIKKGRLAAILSHALTDAATHNGALRAEDRRGRLIIRHLRGCGGRWTTA